MAAITGGIMTWQGVRTSHRWSWLGRHERVIKEEREMEVLMAVNTSTGYRHWKYTMNYFDGENLSPRLLSEYEKEVWPTEEFLQAVCKSEEGINNHPAPQLFCTCGLYARKDITACLDDGGGFGDIIGEVELAGMVVEASKGFVASHAYPKLLYTRQCSTCKESSDPEYDANVKRLAAVYGIDTQPLIHKTHTRLEKCGICKEKEISDEYRGTAEDNSDTDSFETFGAGAVTIQGTSPVTSLGQNGWQRKTQQKTFSSLTNYKRSESSGFACLKLPKHISLELKGYRMPIRNRLDFYTLNLTGPTGQDCTGTINVSYELDGTVDVVVTYV